MAVRRIGLFMSRAQLPEPASEGLEGFEVAQREGHAVDEGEGAQRRLVLAPDAIYMPEIGHRDTKSSAIMGASILLAVFSGLYGIGGLTSGNWGVWLLPVCAVAIVAAIVAGRKWRREEASTRRGGVERDGTYLLPHGVVTRTHDRYQYFPLDSIEGFRVHSGSDQGFSVRLTYTAGGVRRYEKFGGRQPLLDVMDAWFEQARGRE